MCRWRYTGRGGGGGGGGGGACGACGACGAGGGLSGGLLGSATSEPRDARIDAETTRDHTIIGGAIDTRSNVVKKGQENKEKEYRMILLEIRKDIGATMFECDHCGKTYKFATGLSNHKEKCQMGGYSAGCSAGVPPPYDGGAMGGAIGCAMGGAEKPSKVVRKVVKDTSGAMSGAGAAGGSGANKSTRCASGGVSGAAGATNKATSPDELEAYKKKKLAEDTAAAIHAEAKSIVAAAAAMAKTTNKGGTTTTTVDANGNKIVTNNRTNVGNEEHNASFNIKYVKRSEETQEVVRSIVSVAHQFCKGRIIVTTDDPTPGGGNSNSNDPFGDISTSVNADGTTVYNHPTRTISIIETPPEEVSPEEEHDITLEKMTYLIISLIQNNNRLKKENQILRAVIAKLDPDCGAE